MNAIRLVLTVSVASAALLSSCTLPHKQVPSEAEVHAEPPKPPLYAWEDVDSTGHPAIKISLAEQKAYVFRGGKDVAWTMLASGVVAFIVGIPTLRLREDYLAIVTIGIGITLQLVALNTAWLTGGSRGITDIPRPLPGLIDSVGGRNGLLLGLVVVIVIVLYAALEAMVRSPWGRVLKAIREDESAAESLGKTAGLDSTGTINLEKALRANDRLGGHLVSGHVDGIGSVAHFAQVGESWELRVLAPASLAKYLAYKGSITINGVSLTVNRVADLPNGCEVSINLIPHTVENTALHTSRTGAWSI